MQASSVLTAIASLSVRGDESNPSGTVIELMDGRTTTIKADGG